KAKKIAPSASFAFSGKANSLYLAGVEFIEACKEYPIVFTQVGGDKIVPVAMLGLREGENLYVAADGKWSAGYIPAFVRRYPFVLAELEGQQMGVCIDEAYSGLNEKDGEALFDDKGNNTPFLQNALDFLNRYQVEYMRTDRFCQRLKDAGLLMEMNAKADLFDGTSFMVNGLMIVDERKLLQLSDKDALEIFRSGELSWVYAHLVSLSNMNRLVDKLADHKRAEPKTA
ncbi:MAG: SapC family protein, partial [Bdellovibrionales bacterium]|nr:SapC family protein [Ramlibacter sp.]